MTLASFPSPESFAALKQRRARYLVIYRDLYGLQTAAQIESRLTPYLPYLRDLASDDRVRILEIVSWPKTN